MFPNQIKKRGARVDVLQAGIILTPVGLIQQIPRVSPGCGLPSIFIKSAWISRAAPRMQTKVSPVRGGGDLSSAGNDGISSISCIPPCCCANTACPMGLGRIWEVGLFTHHPPGSPWERAEHMDTWCRRRTTKVCLFSTSSLSCSWKLSLVFPCQKQTRRVPTNGRSIKHHRDCLFCVNLSRGIYVRRHTEGSFSARSAHRFMSPSTLMFHIKPDLLQVGVITYFMLSTGTSSKIYLWLSCAKLRFTAKKICDLCALGLKVHWVSQLHTFFRFIPNFWVFNHSAHLVQLLNPEPPL